MSTLDEFRERVLNDKEFVRKFGDAKDKEDILKIAKNNGYNFTNSDLKNKELDDVLEKIAGGAATSINKQTVITGNGTWIFNNGGTEEDFNNWVTEVLDGKTFDEWLQEQS